MKAIKVLGFTALLVFLVSERVIAQDNASAQTSGARVVRGELIYVLCGNGINVRDASLGQILFTSEAFERISPFQGWGEHTKSTVVNGQTTSFVKIEFLNGQEKIGWVAKQFVKLKAECPGSEIPQISTADDSLNNISGLDDSRCCLFPLQSEPDVSYTTGGRRFGASRFNRKTRTTRLHAGVDLYTGLYRKVVAIAPGRVLYSPRKFYMDTFQVAVVHPGGFVARYGEISRYPQHQVRGIEKNVRVRTGQHLGYVGQTRDLARKKVGSQPMLHLELYKGTIAGVELTQPGRKPYERRADVINPTKYVQRWEQMTF